ncbi:MAG TPA: DMT family transporter [Myxococcota bacterium]
MSTTTSSSTSTTTTRSSATAVALLCLGVVSVGAAAILIRLAAAHPLTTSWLRLSIGAVVLVVAALVRRRPWPRGADLLRAVVAGVLLAAHFGLWIASLSSTTVTASVVLCCLQPVFVVLLARVVLREPAPARVVGGIAIALVGAVAIALDVRADAASASMVGNMLALGGAVAIAVYVLVLRAQQADVLPTSAVLTGVAALTILPVAIAVDAPLTPLDGRQAFWLLLLALGPQVIGHTALNAALRRLPASVVSGSILGEPIIAAVLALLILDERIGPQTFVGGVVTLVGIFVLVRAQTTSAASTPATSP